jgi:hypothetical protein
VRRARRCRPAVGGRRPPAGGRRPPAAAEGHARDAGAVADERAGAPVAAGGRGDGRAVRVGARGRCVGGRPGGLRVATQFVIRADGTTAAVVTKGGAGALATCVENVVRGLTFPRPPEPGQSSVELDVAFARRPPS